MLRVGTSGWSYREWRGPFYPQGEPQSRWLAYYAQEFSTVELNATFYRMPTPESIVAWHACVGPGFAFSVKAAQRLTHRRELPTHDELERFVHYMRALRESLGPFLFQFPPARRRDDGWLRAYLELLPAGGRYAFEFRHSSWDHESVHAALQHRGVALCLSGSS